MFCAGAAAGAAGYAFFPKLKESLGPLAAAALAGAEAAFHDSKSTAADTPSTPPNTPSSPPTGFHFAHIRNPNAAPHV